MKVLNRILQRNDMRLSRAVNSINDAGLGRRLTTAGCSGYDHHTMLQFCQFHDAIRNIQFFIIRYVKSNHADHRRLGTTLHICIYTKSGKFSYSKGKIIISLLQIILLRPFGKTVYFINKITGLCRGQLHGFIHRPDLSIHLVAQITSCYNKNIRCTVFYRFTQYLFQTCHAFFPSFLIINLHPAKNLNGVIPLPVSGIHFFPLFDPVIFTTYFHIHL